MKTAKMRACDPNGVSIYEFYAGSSDGHHTGKFFFHFSSFQFSHFCSLLVFSSPSSFCARMNGCRSCNGNTISLA